MRRRARRRPIRQYGGVFKGKNRQRGRKRKHRKQRGGSDQRAIIARRFSPGGFGGLAHRSIYDRLGRLGPLYA